MDVPNDGGVELRDGRDEMNLCEFPIGSLSNRTPKGVTTLEFCREEVEGATGETVTRQLTVEGSARYGLPTPQDEEVALGLLQLTKLCNGFEQPLVYFTQLELLDLLGWGRQSSDYRRLEKAFFRLLGVRFYYRNSWRNNAEKLYESKGGFGLLAAFELRDGRRQKRTAKTSDRQLSLLQNEPEHLHRSEFQWNPVIFRSFQDGYLKKLDYAVVRRLESPAAKRLYRYLDKHFYPPHRMRLEYDLKSLAFETLGMSRNYGDKANIVRYLGPAIEELEGIGFLDRLSPKKRYRKVERGRWTVIFQMKPQEVKEAKPAPSQPEHPLARDLLARGVRNGAELVAKFSAEKIAQQIENYDDRQAHGQDIAEGWLGAAIVHPDGFGFRKGYKPKAEREAAAKARAQRERKEAQAERAGQEEARKEQLRVRTLVDAYLDSLPTAEREALREKAFEEAPAFSRRFCQRSAQGDKLSFMAEAVRRQMVDDHVLRILARENEDTQTAGET